MVIYPYAYQTYRVTSCRPGRGHIVAAAHLQLVIKNKRGVKHRNTVLPAMTLNDIRNQFSSVR